MAKSPGVLKAQAAWLAAIGEPTRLRIIHTLLTGDKSVTELATALKAERVNIAHHLDVLSEVGLVVSARDGRSLRYTLTGAKVTGAVLELMHESGAKITIALS